MSAGSFALILHAHLPFVRHPEYPSYLEEDWLFEAITETYLPLLDVFESLWRDAVDFRLSMTLTPPLISMLDDELLRERYVEHLERLAELAREEVTRRQGHQRWLAEHHLHMFESRLHAFEHKYQRDLVSAFAAWQRRGRLEILTCGATHGFLPLMQSCPEAVRAQIRVAVDHYLRRFGQQPRGIWLPECGYFPGLDQELRDAGLRWFIGESRAVEHATPRPIHGVYAPLYTPSGVAVFARDPETSAQVWSAESGYPGHPDYREFHRDLGFDGDYDHVAPYVQPTGLRKNVGIKYHRITGKTERKELYDPYRAQQVADDHASDFVRNREAQVLWLREVLGREPIIVAPYDAELYGHWWHEGPRFLEMVLRKMSCDSAVCDLVTPSGYLRRHPEQQVAQPNFSTWGAAGFADVWLDHSNEWIYPHLLVAARRMTELADRFPHAHGAERRALDQAARELLLAQSSDWAFIIQTGTSVQYAEHRTVEHLKRFAALAEMLDRGHVDTGVLHNIEARDNLFPDLDYRVYASRTP